MRNHKLLGKVLRTKMLKSSRKPLEVCRIPNRTKKYRALCSSTGGLKWSKVHLKGDAFLQGLARGQHMKPEAPAARSATRPLCRMQSVRAPVLQGHLAGYQLEIRGAKYCNS